MSDVKRYRVSYMNGVIEEDGSPRSFHDSEPMVLASDYDALLAHNAELRRALEDHLARFIGLDKALDDAARAALSAGRSGE